MTDLTAARVTAAAKKATGRRWATSTIAPGAFRTALVIDSSWTRDVVRETARLVRAWAIQNGYDATWGISDAGEAVLTIIDAPRREREAAELEARRQETLDRELAAIEARHGARQEVVAEPTGEPAATSREEAGTCTRCGRTVYRYQGGRLELSDGSSYCAGGGGTLTRHELPEPICRCGKPASDPSHGGRDAHTFDPASEPVRTETTVEQWGPDAVAVTREYDAEPVSSGPCGICTRLENTPAHRFPGGHTFDPLPQVEVGYVDPMSTFDGVPYGVEEAEAHLAAGFSLIGRHGGYRSCTVRDQRQGGRELGAVAGVVEALGRGMWVRFAAYRHDGSRVGYYDTRLGAAEGLRADSLAPEPTTGL